LNFEYFIAKRIISGRKTAEDTKNSGTRPIIRISVMSIAIGLAVMLISVAIVTGFQSEIRAKVIGFGSHIQITSYDSDNTIETSPVDRNQSFYPHLDTVPGIRHIQVYATKSGIIKTDEEIQGVIIKGIGTDFDWSFFEKNLIKGKRIHLSDTGKSNDIVISNIIAKKLKLEVGDKLLMYFIQQPPRLRKFEIAGIYESGLEKFDQAYVLADIRHIQKLNDWDENQVSGFEVLLENFSDLEKMDEFIYKYIGMELYSTKITDRHRDIFGWLELQDWNVVIIIALMVLVAGINMISALLILILERTNMIGILKAMGANNWSIRKVFLYNATYLISIGLLWGNIIGVSLCMLQKYFGIITLPKESYYISVVPINFDWLTLLLLNIGTLLLCTLMLIIPSYVVTKITPVKAIRFN